MDNCEAGPSNERKRKGKILCRNPKKLTRTELEAAINEFSDDNALYGSDFDDSDYTMEQGGSDSDSTDDEDTSHTLFCYNNLFVIFLQLKACRFHNQSVR
jgi:hypothetical protein